MQVETYFPQQKSFRIDIDTERESLLRSLGFSALYKKENKHVSARQAVAKSLGIDCLTDQQAQAVATVFPTVYSVFGPKLYERMESVSDYAFDNVPTKVLRGIDTIKGSFTGLFDGLYIATPERQQPLLSYDPVLFGTIGRKIYPMAKWGDEKVLSLKDIEAISRKRRRRQVARLLLEFGLVFFPYIVGFPLIAYHLFGGAIPLYVVNTACVAGALWVLPTLSWIINRVNFIDSLFATTSDLWSDRVGMDA